MTKDASFKKVVRRHAEETGKRYTEALTELEGVDARMTYDTPNGDRLVAHLRDRYGVGAVGATQISVHNTYVFRIDRHHGDPWVARVFPPRRPRSGVEAMPPSCDSSRSTTSRRNVSRSTTRCPTWMDGRSS